MTWIFSKIIFAQSLCILHSDCEFCTVTVHWTCVIVEFFFKKSWVKSCAIVSKDQLPLVAFVLFLWCLVYARYIIVTFEFLRCCTPVHQSTNSYFTVIYRCVKGCKGGFCCFDQKMVKMGHLCCKSKWLFAGKFGLSQKVYKWG